MDPGHGALAFGRPHPTDDRRLSQPVFILGPDREPGCRMRIPNRVDVGLKPPFLKAAWATGSVVVARGRGRYWVKLRERSASQPRWERTGRPS